MRCDIPSDGANVAAGPLTDKRAHVVIREFGTSKMRLEVAFVCSGVTTMLAMVRHGCCKGLVMGCVRGCKEKLSVRS